jgi:hypothetical protein
MATQTVSVVPTILWDDGFLFFFSFSEGTKSYLGGWAYLPETLITGTDTGGKISEKNRDVFDQRSKVETIKYSARNSQAVKITFDDFATVSYVDILSKTWTVQFVVSVAG